MDGVVSRRGGDAFSISMDPPRRGRVRPPPAAVMPTGTRRLGSSDSTTSTLPRASSTVARRSTMAVLNPELPPAGPTGTGAPQPPSGRAASSRDAPGAAMDASGSFVVTGTANDNSTIGLPHDLSWQYSPPPCTQTTAVFDVPISELPMAAQVNAAPDQTHMRLELSSAFDSGNACAFVQRGPLAYDVHTSSDCQGSPQECSNKQWWYFAVRGVLRGVTLSFTVLSVPFCKTLSYGYAPAVATCPMRPGFVRLPGRVAVQAAANPPPPKPAAGVSRTGTPPGPADEDALAATTRAGRKKNGSPSHADIFFDYTFEMDDALLAQTRAERLAAASNPVPSTSPTAAAPTSAASSSMPVTYLFANTFPYSYARLQRHLTAWVPHATGAAPPGLHTTHRPDPPSLTIRAGPATPTAPIVGTAAILAGGGGGAGKAADPVDPRAVYTHRELLNLTPDGQRVDLVTITGAIGTDGSREDPFSAQHPLSSSLNLEAQVGPGTADRVRTERPLRFPKKQYVVLSARVHPGEVPASHILHGAVEMLLSGVDPRAEVLRQKFVFLIVPMINPDGVARGHSRADPVGQNLNRLYKDPHPLKQPTCLAIREMLLAVQTSGRLALYIDMHAHSNKKGAFLFGNAMDAVPQVQNLLYAKLASLNSPYMDFPSCNFSEQNMYAVGKGGGGKDGSARVMLYNETGFTHSYTLEMNYVAGPPMNRVTKLPGIPGEENDISAGAMCPKYSPSTFHDVGRGLLSALLDLKGFNPASRLPQSPFKDIRGVALWVQRALLVDAWEQQRRMQALATGVPLSVALNTVNASANATSGGGSSSASPKSSPAPGGSLSAGAGGDTAAPSNPAADLRFTPCSPSELPAVVTTRPSTSFPPTTTYKLSVLAATCSSSVSGAVPSSFGSGPAPSFGPPLASSAAAAAGAGSAAAAAARSRASSQRRRASGTGGSKPAASGSPNTTNAPTSPSSSSAPASPTSSSIRVPTPAGKKAGVPGSSHNSPRLRRKGSSTVAVASSSSSTRKKSHSAPGVGPTVARAKALIAASSASSSSALRSSPARKKTHA